MTGLRVIGLCGEIASGKSEVARILDEDHGFVRVKMTDPINAMLRGLGLGDYELEGAGKEKPCALLCGATPRHAQQTLGTEWGRDLIAPGLWLHHWTRTACDVLDHGGNVVCENIRFPDECDAIRALGGEIWHVDRPGIEGPQSAHISEHHRDFRDSADWLISNDGSLDDLRAQVQF